MPTDVKSLLREELEAQFALWEQPAFRITQLLEWLYVRRVTSWDAMTNLPKKLRAQLAENYSVQALELVRKQGSRDITQKFLWKLADGALIESVLIPANPALYGEASDRHTLCISTQVGCAYGCKFCASGLDGWKRNLAPNEIVEQVLAIERWNEAESKSGVASTLRGGPGGLAQSTEKSEPPHVGCYSSEREATRNREPGAKVAGPKISPPDTRLINNLVIMGMGEPLSNYENLLKALRILNAPWGGGIGARKITISTSGLVPQIRRLADEPEQFRLAISLHGATDEVRQRIMPVNRKYPLKELTAALEYYQAQKDRMITFEYILIAGVNDATEQTRPLGALARHLRAKVNLIPYNRVDGLPWERPSEEVCEEFLAALEQQRVPATLRREKGHDIDAACGQLRLRTEREFSQAAT